MWRVSTAGGSVDLVGSVHVLRQGTPLPPAARIAVETADVVVFETDLDGLASASLGMLARGTLPEGTSLRDVVSESTYREVARRLDASDLDIESFSRMRPWMLGLTIASFELFKAGFSPSEGVDIRLWELAGEAGAERRALETVDEQIALFAELDREQSEAFLRYTLDDLDTLITSLDELTRAWAVGDMEELGTLLHEGFEEAPDLFDSFVTRRNRAWLPEIESLLRQGRPALVVVGALHLVGDGGLIEMLRERGYRVQQL